MSSTKAFFLVLALGAVVACRDNAAVQAPNEIPVATAGVIDTSTGEVKRMLTVPYDGQPATFTLDGSKSYDPDGTIESYRWLSGVKPDPDAGVQPGVHRVVPDGAEGGQAWPADSLETLVTLPRGEWTFILWVKDNMGDWSDPSSVKIAVGEDPIAACSAKVLPGVSDACKTCSCGQGAMCPDLLTETSCNQDCWNLVYCVSQHCGPTDVPCIVANCSMYLAGATQAQAGMSCTAPCKDVCQGM